jgi:energy-coupling factor transporter transmembrane protein EcfT
MLFTAIAWIIIVAFAVTFVVTILALCGVIKKIPPGFLKLLFGKMILEVIAGGFYIFYTGLSTFPVEDISGDWKYRCTQQGANYQHGGICTIEKIGAGYIPTYKITGQRLWKRKWTDADPGKKADYPKPLTWDSMWAAQTDDNSIKFTYIVHTETGIINGFTDGKLKVVNGKAVAMFGSFYQLPPSDPMFGAIEFSRKANDKDVDWPIP